MIKLDGQEGALKLEEFLKNNNCMIRFHMYGCIWCNKMKPEWDKLSHRLSGNRKDVLVLDVDSDAVSNMSHPMKNSINGYPTIIYSPKGANNSFSKFEDELGRTAENMENWLNTVSRKSSHSSLSSRSIYLSPSVLKTLKSLKKKRSKKGKKSSKRSKRGGSRKMKNMRRKTYKKRY